LPLAPAAAVTDDRRRMFHCVILFRLRAGIPLQQIRGARDSLQALIETLSVELHGDLTHDSMGYTLAGVPGTRRLRDLPAASSASACWPTNWDLS
jgi:hypothetical protein